VQESPGEDARGIVEEKVAGKKEKERRNDCRIQRESALARALRRGQPTYRGRAPR
jgi:hypothetical protein